MARNSRRRKYFPDDTVVDVQDGMFNTRIRQGRIDHHHPTIEHYYYVVFDDEYSKGGKYVADPRITIAVNPHID